MPKVNTKKVTWDEVDEWCKSVSDKIYGSGWRPEVIIAISRGGYVPGRLVCDRLVVGDLVSLQISHWPSAAQIAKEATVKYPLDYDLNHKRVLIMDDIADTGDSIIVAKDYIWTNCRPDEIKVATLQWISSSSKIKPDFFAEEVKGWIWYQYPWTRLEDIIGFIKRIVIEEKGRAEWTMGDLKKKFEEWYGVTFDEWFYARSLDYLVSKGTLAKGKKGYHLASR
ncbi:MAG: phosphoribosyltransferase [Candidatus Methanomethylicaceae archaeon]